MTFNRVLHYRFRLACCWACAVAVFFCSLAASVLAQETGPSSAATSASTSQPVVETVSGSPTLNPAADSNLHSTTDLRNEVTAEPRRFQYGLQVTIDRK